MLRVMKRRPSILIYMRILELLRDEPRGPTRLAQSVNLAYDKCAPYMHALEAKGLIRKDSSEGKDVFAVTQDGIQVYLDWQKVWEKLKP
jgi:predicted transcriptional regulator